MYLKAITDKNNHEDYKHLCVNKRKYFRVSAAVPSAMGKRDTLLPGGSLRSAEQAAPPGAPCRVAAVFLKQRTEL